MRLIDADALMKHFATSQALDNDRDVLYCNGVLDVISREPSVDAAPVVHARWEDDHMDIKCSACGTAFHDDMFWIQGDCIAPKYCPSCGARMDAKEVDHGKET